MRVAGPRMFHLETAPLGTRPGGSYTGTVEDSPNLRSPRPWHGPVPSGMTWAPRMSRGAAPLTAHRKPAATSFFVKDHAGAGRSEGGWTWRTSVGTVSTLRQLQEATPLSPSGCSDPQWQTRSAHPDTAAPSRRWARRYLPAGLQGAGVLSPPLGASRPRRNSRHRPGWAEPTKSCPTSPI